MNNEDQTNRKDPQELFVRYYNLERESLNAKEFQRELKAEYKYHADDNPRGIDKETLDRTCKAAVALAKADDLKEKSEELKEIDAIVDMYQDKV